MRSLYPGYRLPKSPPSIHHQVNRPQKCFLSNPSSPLLPQELKDRPFEDPVYTHSTQDLYGHKAIPADLLRVALQVGGEKDGPPARYSTKIQGQIRSLLFLNGSPQHAPLLDAILRIDLQERTASDGVTEKDMTSDVTGQSTPPLDGGSQIARSLDAATGLDDIVRITITALRSEEGRHELERSRLNLERVLCGLELNLPLLASLNTIACGFRRHSIRMGRTLCALGMRLSSAFNCATAMRHYILDCYAHQYDLPVRSWKRILNTLVSAASDQYDIVFKGWRIQYALAVGVKKPVLPQVSRFGAWQKHDALRLLTGWKTAGIDGPEEKREVSIVDCIRQDDEMSFQRYLRALGRLHASESLWRLWLHRQANNSPNSASSDPLSIMFIKAFIVAGDVRRAAQIIMGSGTVGAALPLTYWRDLCMLDHRHRLGYTSDPSVLRKLLSDRIEECFIEASGIGRADMDYLPLLEDALNVRWIPSEESQKNIFKNDSAQVKSRRSPMEGVHIRKNVYISKHVCIRKNKLPRGAQAGYHGARFGSSPERVSQSL